MRGQKIWLHRKQLVECSASCFCIGSCLKPHQIVDLCHMAAGMAVFGAQEEIEFVNPLAGARAAVFDERNLKTHSQIHDHVANNAAGAAGGDGK